MRTAFAGVLIFLLASPAQAASYMVGTWFGHGQPEDKASMYIDRMRPDAQCPVTDLSRGLLGGLLLAGGEYDVGTGFGQLLPDCQPDPP